MVQDPTRTPRIEYPCEWGFKVIGQEEAAIRDAIRECLRGCLGDLPEGRPAEIRAGRTSGGGKYVSLSLTVRVDSEEQRNTLFQALAGRPEIRIVI